MVGLVTNAVTLSIAVLGAALGVINTVNSLNQNRVKLKVRRKSAYFLTGEQWSDKMCSIEVINLSAFPVNVREIGFTLNGNTARKGNRATILAPLTDDRKPFPRRLASREAVTGYFELHTLPEGIGRAYVMTDCDEVAYGQNRWKK